MTKRLATYGTGRIGRVAAATMVLLLSLQGLTAQTRGLVRVAEDVVGTGDFEFGRQYAVMIGINAYEQWTPLRQARQDAEEIREILAERFYIDEFIELYDQDATAGAIRRLFARQLPARLEENDSILIYYAGHGYLDESETGFWIPVDGGTDVFEQDRWLPNTQIRNYVDNLPARQVLLIVDSCFSGDLLDLSRGAPPQFDSAYFEEALQYSARQALTSGASETVPDQSEFAEELKTFLRRSDEPLVDPLMMYNRVRRGVTETLPLSGELPGHETGGSFVLFLRHDDVAPATTAGASSAERRVPSLSAVVSYGSVRISTETAGTVYLDGDLLGSIAAGSSAVINDVETGGRSIEIRYDDGERETNRVTVQEGTTARASFSYAEQLAPPEYRVGDRGPAGGIIFYDKGEKSDGWRYLEAAPQDIDIPMTWNDAMSSARSFQFGGYSPWRLPTQEELNWMYENLHEEGVGGFTDGYYWSSSESSDSGSWSQGFGYGYQSNNLKFRTRQVRVVRAF